MENQKPNTENLSKEVKDAIASIGFFIEQKAISEDAGLDLILKIKSSQIDLSNAGKELASLIKQRVIALEKLKDDESIKGAEKQQIIILYNNVKSFLN